MFERWTDVLSGVATAAGIVYVGFEIARRQRKLRDVFDVLEAKDRSFVDDLEGLIKAGTLQRFTESVPA